MMRALTSAEKAKFQADIQTLYDAEKAGTIKNLSLDTICTELQLPHPSKPKSLIPKSLIPQFLRGKEEQQDDVPVDVATIEKHSAKIQNMLDRLELFQIWTGPIFKDFMSKLGTFTQRLEFNKRVLTKFQNSIAVLSRLQELVPTENKHSVSLLLIELTADIDNYLKTVNKYLTPSGFGTLADEIQDMSKNQNDQGVVFTKEKLLEQQKAFESGRLNVLKDEFDNNRIHNDVQAFRDRITECKTQLHKQLQAKVEKHGKAILAVKQILQSLQPGSASYHLLEHPDLNKKTIVENIQQNLVILTQRHNERVASLSNFYGSKDKEIELIDWLSKAEDVERQFADFKASESSLEANQIDLDVITAKVQALHTLTLKASSVRQLQSETLPEQIDAAVQQPAKITEQQAPVSTAAASTPIPEAAVSTASTSTPIPTPEAALEAQNDGLTTTQQQPQAAAASSTPQAVDASSAPQDANVPTPAAMVSANANLTNHSQSISRKKKKARTVTHIMSPEEVANENKLKEEIAKQKKIAEEKAAQEKALKEKAVQEKKAAQDKEDADKKAAEEKKIQQESAAEQRAKQQEAKDRLMSDKRLMKLKAKQSNIGLPLHEKEVLLSMGTVKGKLGIAEDALNKKLELLGHGSEIVQLWRHKLAALQNKLQEIENITARIVKPQTKPLTKDSSLEEKYAHWSTMMRYYNSLHTGFSEQLVQLHLISADIDQLLQSIKNNADSLFERAHDNIAKERDAALVKVQNDTQNTIKSLTDEKGKKLRGMVVKYNQLSLAITDYVQNASNKLNAEKYVLQQKIDKDNNDRFSNFLSSIESSRFGNFFGIKNKKRNQLQSAMQAFSSRETNIQSELNAVSQPLNDLHQELLLTEPSASKLLDSIIAIKDKMKNNFHSISADPATCELYDSLYVIETALTEAACDLDVSQSEIQEINNKIANANTKEKNDIKLINTRYDNEVILARKQRTLEIQQLTKDIGSQKVMTNCVEVKVYSSSDATTLFSSGAQQVVAGAKQVVEQVKDNISACADAARGIVVTVFNSGHP